MYCHLQHEIISISLMHLNFKNPTICTDSYWIALHSSNNQFQIKSNLTKKKITRSLPLSLFLASYKKISVCCIRKWKEQGKCIFLFANSNGTWLNIVQGFCILSGLIWESCMLDLFCCWLVSQFYDFSYYQFMLEKCPKEGIETISLISSE